MQFKLLDSPIRVDFSKQRYDRSECYVKSSADSCLFIKLYSLKDRTVLIYNRIPKCASDTLVHLARGFRSRLRVARIPLKYWHKILDRREIRHICKLVSNALVRIATSQCWFARRWPFQKTGDQKVTLFEGHIYHIDLEQHCAGLVDGAKVIWMNQIRDPVERFVSGYYYRRSEEHVSYFKMLNDSEKYPVPDEV